MPKVSDSPVNLRPYLFHGVELEYEGRQQAEGQCPFCQANPKFRVSVATGLWKCLRCNRDGNPLTFLRQLWEESGGSAEDYENLAKDRGLLFSETLVDWGVRQSLVNGEWIVPGWGVDGKLSTLYRYAYDFTGKRRILMNCPGDVLVPPIKHGLHGIPLYRAELDTVYLAEGIWDGAALWETIQQVTDEESAGVYEGSTHSHRPTKSNCNVLAAPSASVFADSWKELFRDKRVILLYDSDYPKRNGKAVTQSGADGMRRVVKALANVARSLETVHWGEAGYDPSKNDGYDVRDVLLGK